MKTLRYAFWAIVGLCLILVGLANRGVVTVRAMPEAFSDLLNISPDVELPLFVVIFCGVAGGLLIGFFWEWVREHQVRADARAKAREIKALKQELATFKKGDPAKGDDVLALIDG